MNKLNKFALLILLVLLLPFSVRANEASHDATEPAELFFFDNSRFLSDSSLPEDVQRVLEEHNLPLASYVESAGGNQRTAAQTIADEAAIHNVDYRVILTFLEMEHQGLTSTELLPTRAAQSNTFADRVHELAVFLAKQFEATSFKRDLNGHDIQDHLEIAASYTIVNYMSSLQGDEEVRSVQEFNQTKDLFSNVYSQLFGEPPSLTRSSLTVSTTPFMRKPYRINVTINSILDHDSISNENQKMSGTYYDGSQYISVKDAAILCGSNASLGLEFYKKTSDGHCMIYDRHSGYDYGMPNGTNIYPVATGRYYRRIESGGGLYGEIVHDGNGEGYKTWYVHITQHLVPNDTYISNLETPIAKSGSGHLHLTVRKDNQFTDPYGWWSNEEDPLAGLSNGAASQWLWADETPCSSSGATFCDVPDTHNFFHDIKFLKSRGYVNGFSDGLFHPEWSITRAQAALILFRWLKQYYTQDTDLEVTFFSNLCQGQSPSFSDLLSYCDSEANREVVYAAEYMHYLGIINGFSDGSFRPGADITRGEMMSMIIRALKKRRPGEDILTEPQFGGGLGPFSDTSDSPHHENITRGRWLGLVDGYAGNVFRPGNPINRGEFSKIVARSIYYATNRHIATLFNIPSSQLDYTTLSGGNTSHFQVAQRVSDSQPPIHCLAAAADAPIPGVSIDLDNRLVCYWNSQGQFYVIQDVDPDHWARSDIEALYNAGITTGCSSSDHTIYCPNENTTRLQLSKFLLRAKYYYQTGDSGLNYQPPAATQQIFDDVPLSHPWVDWINELYAQGITQGAPDCGSGFNFCPDLNVTRTQMALFLLRTQEGPNYINTLPHALGVFEDVPANDDKAAAIEELYWRGITRGDTTCGSGFRYCPDGPVSRGHAAAFLARAFVEPPVPTNRLGDVCFSTSTGYDIPRVGGGYLIEDVEDEDIVCYHKDVNQFKMYFNGSTNNVAHIDIDALHIRSDGEIWFSTDDSEYIVGIGTVGREDVIIYENGSYSLEIDGSSSQCLNGTDIDALHRWTSSRVYVSTASAADCGSVEVDDEDIVRYYPSNGQFYEFFDGSDVNSLDIDGVTVQSNSSSDANLYITLNSSTCLPTETSQICIDNADIVQYRGPTGSNTTGFFSPDACFDNDDYPGLENEALDAIHVENELECEPPAALPAAPPEADFDASPLSGDAPLEVTFSDTSTGEITSWFWNFGDGEVSTEQHPTHIYQEAGLYDVTLTLIGPGGYSSAQAEITVLGNTPSPTPTATSEVPTITPTATNTQVVPTATPSATPVPSDQVLLALSPATINTGVGQTFDVAIEVMAGEESVDGASAYLNFDPAVLQVVSVTDSDVFQFDLVNQFDNSAGHVDFAAGSFSNLPSGTFTLATVTMQAVAQTDGSSIIFNTSAPRESDATSGGGSVLNGTIPSTVIVSNTTVDASVTLQGRPSPPNARWVVPLRVSLTVPGEDTPAYEFEPTTDENGHFTLTGIEAGTYEVRVKHAHTLQNMQTVTLGAGSNTVDLGTLREGDANDDNFVTIVDFSILAATFAKCEGTTGYDARADFNADGCVTILDFSLLASNFGQSGQSTPEGREATSLPKLGGIEGGHVALSMQPAQRTVSTGDTFTVMAAINAGEQAVDGAQVVLKFDSELLEVVKMGKREALEGKREALPVQLQSEFSNQEGRISFAAGALEAFPNGRIEVLEVELRALAPTDGTSLSFAEGTDVTFGGVSVLGEQAGSTIVISEPTAIRVVELGKREALPLPVSILAAIGLTILAGALIKHRRAG